MASTPATGNGPFEFMSASGRQVSIPLTAFGFDGSKLVVDPAWQPFIQTAPGSVLLAYAQQEGLIAPVALGSPFPAMIFRASDPGAGGNQIKIAVALSSVVASPPIDDPTEMPFSVTVTETEKYPALTAATIVGVLGSRTEAGVATAIGSSPGLVQVLDGSVDSTSVPLALSAYLSGSPGVLHVDGTGSPAVVFTLIAKKNGADSALTHVAITPNTSSQPSSQLETFSLQVAWTKTVLGLTLADLEATVSSELGYEVSVGRPGSGAYSLPAAGITQLSGGGGVSAASGAVFTAQ